MIKKYTLPVLSPGLTLDQELSYVDGCALRDSYQTAASYPHIVIDEFLPIEIIDSLKDSFPNEGVKSEVIFNSGYAGLAKRQINPEACNKEAKSIFYFLNSAPVLRFLEGLSGIEGLIPDPYFNGGGYHETGAGGKLGIHADFRINPKLHLNRRLNLIIYLNENWEESYGGHLEIWDRNAAQCVERVLPIKNRCVVFNTDATSYHGHPDPLTPPDGRTRRSVALYYYTASESIYTETPAHTTDYVGRPNESISNRFDVIKFKMINNLVDWLPPIITRRMIK